MHENYGLSHCRISIRHIGCNTAAHCDESGLSSTTICAIHKISTFMPPPTEAIANRKTPRNSPERVTHQQIIWTKITLIDFINE